MVRKKTAEEIRKLIKADKRYKRIKENFETLPVYNMAIDQHNKDLDMYHKSRPVRLLNPDSPKFMDKLVRASVDDQAYRSRIIAIQKDCIRSQLTLEATVKAFTDYVLLEYSEELKGLRTKEERLMIVRTTLAPFERHIMRVTALKQCCELVIKDIDQAAWSLKLLVSTLEIHSRREMTV